MAKLQEILEGYELKRGANISKLAKDLGRFLVKEFPNNEISCTTSGESDTITGVNYSIEEVKNVCEPFKKWFECPTYERGGCEKGKEKCAVLLGHGTGWKHAIRIDSDDYIGTIRAASAKDWPQDRADRLLKTLGSYIEKK